LILKRQRQNLVDLYVQVNGQQAVNPPNQFTDIHLHYVVEGIGLDESKVARAIELSETKYCSVAATVRGVANLTHSFEIAETAVS
jgi:putative redox protein